MAFLRVLKEGAELQNIDLAKLAKPSVSLGRGQDCDVRLDNRAVGRSHAVISIGSGGLAIQKKSQFGKLWLNGSEVEHSPLKPGDVVVIADFQIRVEGAAGGISAASGAVSGAAAIGAAVGTGLKTSGLAVGGSTDGSLADGGIAVGGSEGGGSTDNATVNSGGVSGVASDGTAPADSAGGDVAVELGIPAVSSSGDSASAAGVGITDSNPAAGGPVVGAPAVGGSGDSASAGLQSADPPVADLQSADSEKTAFVQKSKVKTKLVFKPGAANCEEYEFTKDETSIGRGSICDIVLNDKKSSRKHLVIKRAGMQFIAVDQGSGNGSYINDEKITEKELSGDDVIRIGDTEFTFKAVSEQYLAEQQNFLSVPAHEEAPAGGTPTAGIPADAGLQLAGLQQAGMPSAGLPSAGLPSAGLGELGTIPGLTASTSKKKESLLEKFKRQPLPRKIMIVGALLFVLTMASEDDKGKKGAKKTDGKGKTTASGTASGQAAGTAGASVGGSRVAGIRYEQLAPEKKQFVVNTYQLALDLYKKQEFDRALYETNKLLTVVTEYKDAQDIKRYAEKALEQLKTAAEEKKRKEEEERIQNEISILVKQAEEYFEKGLEKQTRDVISQIVERDPENATALRINQQMEDKEKRLKAEEERKHDIEMKRNNLKALTEEGEKLLQDGKYYEVMSRMLDAPTLGSTDEKLLQQAKDLIIKGKETLKEKTEPFLKKAEESLASSEYAAARDAYYKAIEVDYKNEQAKKGLEKIRDILHEKAKQIYTEALISESVSDFKGARAKYKNCQEQAMPDDIYFGRCNRKFKRLEYLERSVASDTEAKSEKVATESDPAKPLLPNPDEAPQ